MVDFNLPPGSRRIEFNIKELRPGITRLKFHNFEDMGDYFLSRLDEFEARGIRVVTIGVVLIIYEKAPAN